MNIIKLAGLGLVAALVSACGGGGGEGEQSKAPALDGILSTSAIQVRQDGPVSTAHLSVSYSAGFMGDLSPAAGSFEVPAWVTVDGVKVATGAVQFSLRMGSSGNGSYDGVMSVTAPAVQLGTHTICVTMRPADVFDFSGTGAEAACVTGTITND